VAACTIAAMNGPAPLDRPSPTERERLELDLLAAQLGRMRAMLYGYSSRFFDTIRIWALVAIGLLVLSTLPGWEAAGAPVPFIVPFAFLETAFLFHYTVFARRHAERLEVAINERFGHDVLAAHRLEAAFFYPPDAPKVAGLSLGDPLGMFTVATLGYSVGAAILWLAGMSRLIVATGAGAPALTKLAVAGAALWTVTIAGYLIWHGLSRREEDRLLAELARSYRAAASAVPPVAPPPPTTPTSASPVEETRP
jgi:hypothetical protein